MSGSNGWRGEPRPAFPFYVSDWLASDRVRAMTYAQRGAYVECLALQWREGSLSDRVAIALRSGAMSGADIDVVLDAFPVGEDGKRRNPRLERERLILVQRAKTASEAGRKGNQIRWRSGGDPNAIAKDRSSSSSSSIQNPPTPLRGKPPSAASPRKKREVSDPDSELRGQPPWLDSVAREWLAYRAESNTKAYTPRGLRAVVAALTEWGETRSRAALRHSMASGYIGLFEPNGNGKAAPSKPSPVASQNRPMVVGSPEWNAKYPPRKGA